MKYNVFKMNSVFMPVIFPEHVNHVDVKIEGAEVVSAGFFSVDKDGYVKIDEKLKSTSLNIGPNLDIDAYLIHSVLENCGMYSFTDYSDL